MNAARITRRTTLRGLLGCIAMLPAVAATGRFVQNDSSNELARRMTAIYSSGLSAALIGKEYLRNAEHEGSSVTLQELILEGRNSQSDMCMLDNGQLHASLRSWIRDDFCSGRTVQVQGWILSVTEARLMALTAVLG